MNMDFEAAMQFINMEQYDKAVEKLNIAIAKEEEKDECMAIQYRCVLGELLANLGRTQEARAELVQVKEYCDKSHLLPKQNQIASTLIDVIDGRIKPPAPARNPSVPLVPKPVQNRGFISKQMGKRRK